MPPIGALMPNGSYAHANGFSATPQGWREEHGTLFAT